MYNPMTTSNIPKVDLPVPGFEGLTVCVYGEAKARSLSEEMKQGYTVMKEGQAVARSELPEEQKAAVRALLLEKFPEHAAI
jgi:hypothetical protein